MQLSISKDDKTLVSVITEFWLQYICFVTKIDMQNLHNNFLVKVSIFILLGQSCLVKPKYLRIKNRLMFIEAVTCTRLNNL